MINYGIRLNLSYFEFLHLKKDRPTVKNIIVDICKLGYLTATLIVKEVIQAHDYKIGSGYAK